MEITPGLYLETTPTLKVSGAPTSLQTYAHDCYRYPLIALFAPTESKPHLKDIGKNLPHKAQDLKDIHEISGEKSINLKDTLLNHKDCWCPYIECCSLPLHNNTGKQLKQEVGQYDI